MAKRPRFMTADNMICELDKHDLLDGLDDPQESVMMGSDDEFTNIKDIDDDNQEDKLFMCPDGHNLCLSQERWVYM